MKKLIIASILVMGTAACHNMDRQHKDGAAHAHQGITTITPCCTNSQDPAENGFLQFRNTKQPDPLDWNTVSHDDPRLWIV